MGFSFETGFGDVDPIYSSFGAGGYATVNTDVSYSSEPEQPSTPTGTGTGTFLSGIDSSGLWNTLSNALNYAIVRDQQKMTAVYGPAVASTQAAVAQAQQQAADRRLLLLAALGVGVFLLVKS